MVSSKVISFRVPEDLYIEFEGKCRDEGVSPATKLREYVEDVCHTTTNEVIIDEPQVKVIEVDGEVADKVANADSKKSWFPLDFSPLFGKGR